MTRKLTSEEIEDILDFLTIDSEKEWETAVQIYNNIKNELVTSLSEVEIYPQKIPELKEKIIYSYNSSRIQEGHAVGVDAALAIGEPTTQCTLNTFHSAGISAANVTLGVPRFNEVLNASKNQKTNVMKARLLNNNKNLQEVRDKCRSIFEELYVDQSIDKHDIVYKRYDNLNDNDKKWYKCWDMLYNKDYRKCDWSIRLYFNKLTLVQHKITIQKISSIIFSEYGDCFVVESPTHIAILDIYIDTTNIDCPEDIFNMKKKVGRKFDSEKDFSFINDENKDYFFIRSVALEYILDIKLSGMEGIQKTYYQKDSSTGEWLIECSGTNMRATMNHPDIDFKTVQSNNMWEILVVLGIEAARKFLISEITTIISFGGTFIDPAHATLLADSMTSTGTISSVNRYGIGKGIGGVFTAASFEQSHQTMLDAPIRGVSDDLSTVSAAIIMGKRMPIGTGYFDMYCDKKLLNVFYNKGEVKEKEDIKVEKVVGKNAFKKIAPPIKC